jgi:hypothetical protein
MDKIMSKTNDPSRLGASGARSDRAQLARAPRALEPGDTLVVTRLDRLARPRLVAAGKIHCQFLALDRWQVEGKRCSVGHDGCGARLIRDAIRRNTDLLRESLALRHSRHINLMPRA